MKPATPLPWRVDLPTTKDSVDGQRGIWSGKRGVADVYGYPDNAAYIVAACNNMPRLLALLNAAVDDDADWLNDAIAALKELGART